MKANEFVKKFGIIESKELLNAQCFTMRQIALFSHVHKHIEDLKRLVESHAIVDMYGGLDEAKKLINSQHNLYTDMKLVKAIADVESCQ